MPSQEPNPPILGDVLRTLELRDFAIVDDLAIELGPGLNVLTGETGAGKSIVIDALELLAGGRADAAMIRTGADTAMVQGEFTDPDLTSASRRLSVSGRHSARIEGELVSVAELSERCGERIAVFAQHGALELQSATAQRAQLDRLLPQPARVALESFRVAYERLTAVGRELAAIEDAQRERVRRLEVLAFQIEEIAREKPVVGEDERLEAELDTLRNAERIVTGAASAFAALSDAEPNAVVLAAEALRQLRAAGRHATMLQQLADDLEAAVSALGAVASEVESFLATFEADPGRLDAVQGRLSALDNLKRKYGPDIAAVLQFHGEAVAQRDSLERLDAQAGELELERSELEAELSTHSAALRAARVEAAGKLTAGVTPLLARLGMPDAVFTVEVDEAQRRTVHGDDAVEFRFNANPGEAPTSLAQIASGGEMSRVMLALHVVTGTTQGTVAFDEIDSGIGGRAAHDVGALLSALARTRQVLVVTHLAQVAAFADDHYVVAKEPTNGRTVTTVTRLAEDARPAELARMLSGSVTRASLEHASELLTGAKSTAAHEALNLLE
ncbi:MAG TPA: DNA repair protein RecN [Trueperaceae bacterium]|nr:DNA repair protein RecN [Trueperaceae bacterium]